MATETIADFLARGGTIEKSNEAISLDQLLQNKDVFNQRDAENVTKNLNESLISSLDKLGVVECD